MFKCQQSGVWTFQGQGSHLFRCFFFFVFVLNNNLFDKLSVDPVLWGGEVRAGEEVEVIVGWGMGVRL